jgi:hypothetical protein
MLTGMVMLTLLSSRAQGVFTVPGSPGWTLKLLKESDHGPQLRLRIHPTVAGAALRRGFEITVHRDNDLLEVIKPKGKSAARISLSHDHVYTLEVQHEAAYRKVIQWDTRGLDRQFQLDCHVDLFLRPNLEDLTFEDELTLSMPLSVVWYDEKRNLFRHDAYLHHDGIERLRSHLALRDPSLQASPLKGPCTKPPENGAACQHR